MENMWLWLKAGQLCSLWNKIRESILCNQSQVWKSLVLLSAKLSLSLETSHRKQATVGRARALKSVSSPICWRRYSLPFSTPEEKTIFIYGEIKMKLHDANRDRNCDELCRRCPSFCPRPIFFHYLVAFTVINV